MAVILYLGSFLDFIEIAVVVVPIVAPDTFSRSICKYYCGLAWGNDRTKYSNFFPNTTLWVCLVLFERCRPCNSQRLSKCTKVLCHSFYFKYLLFSLLVTTLHWLITYPIEPVFYLKIHHHQKILETSALYRGI